MRGWLPAAALGGALALVGLGAVFVLQSGRETTAAERADAIARELRCPDCQGLSVADAPTGSAGEIRRQIDELIASGATVDDVRTHFVARYGEWILLAPTSPAAWITPFVVVVAGIGALGAWLMTRRRSASPPRVAASPEQRRRLSEEAEALDA
ncbi:MAG: cytochrome c-type biogenesis protein CcmH [Chloroflexota bacterium]|nr:cytochrome c-type biogenesis protein CcmH [Chloroflexota bacterium]